MLSRLKTALRALLRRAQTERELDEEFRCHVEQQTEQNIRLGMSPEEALQAALKSFGGVEQAKEQSRDARGVRWIEELWQDLRYGGRMLARNPGFTFVATLSLALGARAGDVLWLVLREALLLVLIGIAIGLPAILAATRLIEGLLFGLTSSDPMTITLATLVMIAVAAMAGYLPARRAARVDPMVALHNE
jgi:hypothetical protein